MAIKPFPSDSCHRTLSSEYLTGPTGTTAFHVLELMDPDHELLSYSFDPSQSYMSEFIDARVSDIASPIFLLSDETHTLDCENITTKGELEENPFRDIPSASEESASPSYIEQFTGHYMNTDSGFISPHLREYQIVDDTSEYLDPSEDEIHTSKSWTTDEDKALTGAVEELKSEDCKFSWTSVREKSGLFDKTPKQLRERYINHLDPQYYRGSLSGEEEISFFLIMQNLNKTKEKAQKQWAQVQPLLQTLTGKLITLNTLKNRYPSIAKRITVLPSGKITIKPRKRTSSSRKEQ